MRNVIDVWDPRSWGHDLSELLERNSALVKRYRESEAAFSLACRSDPMLRYRSGPDGWDEYHQFKWQVGSAMSSLGVVLRCWHYTNICEHEKDQILRSGMACPSVDTLRSRLLHAAAEHGLSPRTAADLLENSVFEERMEAGALEIWATAKPVHHTSGDVDQLVRWWGGEAVFWNAPQEARDVLTSIGTATVIELAVPASALVQACMKNVGSSAVDHYEHSLGLYHYPELPDIRIAEDLGPECIIGIHQSGDQTFNEIGTPVHLPGGSILS